MSLAGLWTIIVLQTEMLGVDNKSTTAFTVRTNDTNYEPYLWQIVSIQFSCLILSDQKVSRFPFYGSWSITANGQAREQNKQYTLYNLEQIVLIGFQILMTQRSAPINCRNHYTEGTVSYRVNCVFLFPYYGVRHKKDTFSSMPRCLIFPFCFIVVSFESQTVHQGYIFVLIVGTQSTCACFS